MERHYSRSPLLPDNDNADFSSRSEPDFITPPHRDELQGDSYDLSNDHSTASSTSSSPSSSGNSSPRPQWTVPGNFIDAHEKVGLPGIQDLDGFARAEAARVVRSHTRRRVGVLSRKQRVGHNRKPLSNRMDRDRAARRSADISADVEHDAEVSTTSLPMGGGVLSALLTLYNQQDSGSFSAASTPERLLGGVPPERPRLQASTHRHRRLEAVNEEPQRGRPLSVSNIGLPSISSSRTLSVDGQDKDRRGESHKRRSKIPLPSSVFTSSKPRQARSDAGVLGPLIASTGNLMGVGSPASGELQPDVKRPGYHLSRCVCSLIKYLRSFLTTLFRPFPLRYSQDSKAITQSDLELHTFSQTYDKTNSHPGAGTGSTIVSKPPHYKTKWTGVLKDLPPLGHVRSFGTQSAGSTPAQTPSPLEEEKLLEKKYIVDENKKDRKRKRKKVEVFVRVLQRSTLMSHSLT